MADITKLKVNGTSYDIKDAVAQNHINDSTIHVTTEDKAEWSGKQDALKVGGTQAVDTNVDSAPTAGHANALVTSGGVASAMADIAGKVDDLGSHKRGIYDLTVYHVPTSIWSSPEFSTVSQSSHTEWELKDNEMPASPHMYLWWNENSRTFFFGPTLQHESDAAQSQVGLDFGVESVRFADLDLTLTREWDPGMTAEDKLATMSDIPEVVAPADATATGQAADALATDDALRGKFDKTGGQITGNVSITGNHSLTVGATSYNDGTISVSGVMVMDLPVGKSGTVALTSDIPELAAPSTASSAQGKAADAKATGDALALKLDKASVVALSDSAVTGQAADAKSTNDKIKAIEAAIVGGTIFLGVTRTTISDGQVIANIEVKDGTTWRTILAKDIKDGNFVVYKKSDTSSLEYIAAEGRWYELGSTGMLKAMAFADTASTATNYTPAGSVAVGEAEAGGEVSQPTFSGTQITGLGTSFEGKEGDISASFTPAGTVAGTVTGTTSTTIPDYTPEGTVTGTVTGTANVTISQVSVSTETTGASKGSAFTEATYDPGTETLELVSADFLKGFSVTPTVSSATTTTVVNATNKLTFTGTKKTSTTISGSCSTTVNTSNKLTFTGSSGTATGKFTPDATVTVNSFTPSGTVSKPTFTPAKHSHDATFSGTPSKITVHPDTAS